jgi:5-oxoprolinase (ATP-hydrolysing) subunit A
MARVDLNCDMGESYGAWTIGNDAAVLPWITSASIACGFHAGDPGVMRSTVERAAAHGVSIGAHPGLPDLVGFGRRELAVSPQEVFDMMVYQIGALQAIAHSCGTALRHVKPHGALYNMAAQRRDLADAIAKAIAGVDTNLVLFGLSGSALIAAGAAHGLRTASEVFADRNYRADGTLVPRSTPDALIADADRAAARVVRMVRHGVVTAIDGAEVRIVAESICIHGDAAGAPQFAERIRAELRREGIAALAPGDAHP